MIFISHKLDEVFDIAERVSVLRDGRLVSSYDTQQVTKSQLISDMVGRSIDDIYPPKSAKSAWDVLLNVSNLAKSNAYQNVSFSLSSGEILGFAGLVGAGRSEVARAIFGAEPFEQGKIEFLGRSVKYTHPSQAIGDGLMYLTEDRKQLGLFLEMDIKDNVAASNLELFTNNLGLLSAQKIQSSGAEAVHKFSIKAGSEHDIVGSLSGGNQQKVLFAKCLESSPKVLIVDEPTRGVDVGAKSTLHMHLRDLANSGMAIIVISSELPEVIGISDRIAVFKEGELQTILPSDSSQEEIMQYAAI